ncbi:hypothetical protein K6119_04410 [Paracrocinitomix mangrovi]|uniref:hypothetical protein n=1 Tax=Paracrocinitomix mangrovi TaxID=2862509 RepID=UPI001C8D2F56|nr:hypothetical protein [Paracrocinitomix mangrovi]UKN02757.1 hypothetical protein K6119_04410 [Paracrocinitomix mangrovi]
MKYILSVIFLVSFYSFSQKNLLKFIPKFESDSLHIYPSAYSNLLTYAKDKQTFRFNGEVIPQFVAREFGLDSLYKAKAYVGIGKFKFDATSKYQGVVVGIEYSYAYSSKIILAVIDKTTNKIVFNTDLAYYSVIEGTAELLQNATICDLDHDGDLDIAVISNTIDYELPTDELPNASGTAGYTYLYENGNLVYSSMSKSLFKVMWILK